jgi:predicted nucleic-acid-binding protein
LFEQTLTEEAPGFIGLVVLVETSWVFRRLYSATRDEILGTVRDLLGTRTLVIEQRDVVTSALAVCETRAADFADAIIVAAVTQSGCTEIVSFGRGALRAGMCLAG